MKRELNDKYLSSLKPPETGRIEVSDTRRVGLRFRLSNTGYASWVYEKRVKGGPKRKHTLGGWPEPVSLSQARKMALEIEFEAAKGIDRVAVTHADKVAAEAKQASESTVQQVIEIYDQLHLIDLRSGAERKRQLLQSLAKHLDRPITDISRKDIQEAVDEKAKTGRKMYANRIRAALMAFSNWAWTRGYIEEHIASGISKAVKETARERVLSVAEIRDIWAATFQMGDLWGPMLRLLILTGQRRGEILKLCWSEIDIDKARIVKAGSQTKNGKAHTTHLSAPALSEILKLRETSSGDGFLFTTTGTTPVSGIGRVKKRLDGILDEGFEGWRLHDFRTAFASALAEAGEPETIVDRILNHSASGSAPSAVARIYNQAEQLPQRALALDKWADIVTGASAKVFELQRG